MVIREVKTINIGKNGLTESSLEEISSILKKYKVAKVKFLQSSPGRNNFNDQTKKILDLCKCVLEKKTGYTILIKRL
jgi:RNA-binding protein YhbY